MNTDFSKLDEMMEEKFKFGFQGDEDTADFADLDDGLNDETFGDDHAALGKY